MRAPLDDRPLPSRRIVVAVAVVVAAFAAAVGAAAAPTYPGVYPKPFFKTPKNAAYCTVWDMLYEQELPQLFCWTPNDGWGVHITWDGRRATARYYRTPPRIVHGVGVLRDYVPRARVLPFGSRWVYRCENPNIRRTCGPGRSGATIYACVSRRTGLTCMNSQRHGYWIGRFRGYRLF